MASRIASRRSCWSMREALLLTAALLVAPVAHAQAGAAPPLGHHLCHAQHPSAATGRQSEPCHAVGCGRSRCVEQSRRRSAQSLRGLPRQDRINAWRRAALPVRRGCVATGGQPRAADQPVPQHRQRASTCGRKRPCSPRDGHCVRVARHGHHRRSQHQPRSNKRRRAAKALFHERIGHVALSCHDCHDTLAGKRLGAAVIPQGHATGYRFIASRWQKSAACNAACATA